MPIKFPQILLSIGLCLFAGLIGSLFTFSATPTWYVTLNKPEFSPPNWIFGPVWTILYILMGVSLYLVWTSKKKSKFALKLFLAQLLLNTLWSIIFFGMRNPTLALVEVVILWVMILLTILEFRKISKCAAYLLFSYLAWVSFATILNLFIVLLN